MGGADGEELDWEALYLRLPQAWNQSLWNATGWNGTAEPNANWADAFAPFETSGELIRAAAKAVVLGLLILATVVGKNAIAKYYVFLTDFQ